MYVPFLGKRGSGGVFTLSTCNFAQIFRSKIGNINRVYRLWCWWVKLGAICTGTNSSPFSQILLGRISLANPHDQCRSCFMQALVNHCYLGNRSTKNKLPQRLNRIPVGNLS